MRKNRGLPFHALIYHQLAECVIQVIITANNMGNAHVMVVNYYCQHVGRAAVTAQNNHIIQNLVLDGHGSLNGVFNRDSAICWHFHTHCKRPVWPTSRVFIAPW